MKTSFISLILLFSFNFLYAQTWTGSTDTDWNTPTNWSTGTVPVSSSNIIIPGALVNYPVFSGNVSINSISMQNGSSLDVNGYSLNLNGVSAYTDFTGATLNNSNVATDIIISLSTGSSGYTAHFRSNIFNDTIVFNISGNNEFFEGDAGPPNQYQGNAIFNINGSLTANISYQSASVFNKDLLVNRTVAGATNLFNAGAFIGGNYNYTNNSGGATSMGNAAFKTQINGTINILANYTSSNTFVLQHVVNQTPGGAVTVQNTVGFFCNMDTLKLTTLNITGYKAGAYAVFYNNDITGNVNIADDAAYGGGYNTSIRNNIITGNSSFTNNGTNSFYDADIAGSGNKYIGNVSFTGAGSGQLLIGYLDSLFCTGDVSINRTMAGFTQAFNSGASIGGNFSYSNTTSGHTYLGGLPATRISGMVQVNVNYSATAFFEMHHFINGTSGGNISVQNSTGFYLANDTLKISGLNITGYKTGAYGYFFSNNITGNVIIADDASFGGGYNTAIRNSTITGNSSFTNNGFNIFYDADAAGTGNRYYGNVTFNGAGPGLLIIAQNDILTCTGNVTINRSTAGITQAFTSGAIINGNFSYTNSTSGNTYLGGAFKTNIDGTIHIDCNYTTPAIFEMHRLINQTNGGLINIQNSTGFNLSNDTLKVTTLNITGYKTGQYGFLVNNDITGNVTLISDASFGGGYNTALFSNVFSGNASFTNNGVNPFYDAPNLNTGNKYFGNATFTGAGSGILYIAYLDSLHCTGNVTINRTAAGSTLAFNKGGTIYGNFIYNNFTAGNTFLGGGVSTNVGGTINISVNNTSPGIFQLFRFINQTAGGNISIQNSMGFNLANDTLKLVELSITGYKPGQHGEFNYNDITGNLTISDDASFASGYNTYAGNNVVAGNTSYTINGSTTFFEGGSGSTGNYYIGNLSITRNNGTVLAGNIGYSEITKNLTLNSAAGINLGRIKFKGSTNSVLEQVSTQPVSISFLSMEKTGAGNLTLNDPVTITNTADLLSGAVYSSTTNNLFFDAGSNYTGGSNASYINGPVTKTGSTPFNFPVGKSGKIAPIGITATGVVTDAFTAEYFMSMPHTSGYDSSQKDLSIHHISSREYWILNRTAGSSATSVSLTWDSLRSGRVNSLPDLRVARWNGSMWKDEGQGFISGNDTAGLIFTAGAVTDFSPFTLASATPLNPLPVTLLSFTATKNNNRVILQWISENESNILQYEIEKSSDGIHYTNLKNIAAQGGSARIIYTSDDNNPVTGNNYYRLKILDIGGRFTYSTIVRINLDKPYSFSIWPNPAKDYIVITDAGNFKLIQIIDITGKLVRQMNRSANNRYSIFGIGKGMYVLRLIGTDETATAKLLIQ